MKKYLIFDLDDTLVRCTHLYKNAKNKFLEIMKDEFDLIDDEMINLEKDFSNIDRKRYDCFGGIKERFLESMVLIYFGLCYKYNKEYNTKIELKLRKITLQNGSLTDVDLFSETIEVLEKLKKDKFPLYCFTAGDEDWQMEKINKFKLKKYFNKIFIKYFKNELEFGQIIQDINGSVEIDYNDFIMIGNSYKSDILPANKIGINTIYIIRPNNGERDIYEDTFFKTRKISEDNLKNNYKISNLEEIFGILEKIK